MAVRKTFEAEHYLPMEKGMESEIHTHDYTVEIALEGRKIDEKGYLLDIDRLEDILTNLTIEFGRVPLNERAEFNGIEPTIENFSKVLWRKVKSKLNSPNISAVEVKIWEGTEAYASYRGDLES